MTDQLDLYADEVTAEDVWAEELPDGEAPGCCWGTAGCFTTVGTFGGTYSSAFCAGSGGCAC
jgi:hypothetical protein